AVGIAHAGAIGRDRGDVAFVVLHRGAVGGHRGDIAVGIGHHQAVGVQHRVARGHAVHGDVIGQVEGDVVAVIGLGDHDVAVGVVPVHGVAGLAVDAHVGRVGALRADVPARVGNVVDLSELVFRGRLAAH